MCIFFITPVSELSGQRRGSYDVFHMGTFGYSLRGDNLTYDRRDRRADIHGELFFQEGDLVIKTNEPQPGCRGVAGLFDGGPGDRGVIQYSTVKKIAAVGIAVTKNKTFIYGGVGVKRREEFLISGDIVVVVRRKSGYSYVRYVNPDFMIDGPGATTNGWIRSSDLVNPFPPSVKK